MIQKVNTLDTIEKKALFMKFYMDVKLGCNVSLCCKGAGISRTTFYSWRKADEEFDALATEAEEQFIDWLEQQLYKSAQDGNPASIIFGLCNKGKHRGWQSVQKIEHRQTEPLRVKIEVFGRNGNGELEDGTQSKRQIASRDITEEKETDG